MISQSLFGGFFYAMTFYERFKEPIDQSLHFLMGFAIALLTITGRVYIWAVPISFVMAYGFAMTREWYQHNRLVWWNLDLSFAGLGAIVGSAILFFV